MVWIPWAAGLLALVLLLQSMDVQSRNFGFFYDELWDYIPSVALNHSDSLAGSQETRLFHHQIPLVTGPYQGALKAWISSPLIRMLGTSPRALRSLNVAFAMLYLLAIYWALLPAIGKKWAWVAFVVPLVDTNFLVTVPMDMGPTLFQNIFVSLILGALFRYVCHHELKHYRRIWFFNGCLLAQKLTAIPIVISFAVLTICLALRYHRALIFSKPLKGAVLRLVLAPAVLFLIPMIPYFVYLYKSGLEPLFSATADAARAPYLQAITDNFSFFRNMFDGTDWYQRITLNSIPTVSPPLIFQWGLAAIPVSILLFLIARKHRDYEPFALIAAGLGAAGFLLMPAFRGLDRPWHFYILSPLLLTACAAATVHVLSQSARRFGRFRIHAGVILAAGCLTGIGLSAVRGMALVRRMEDNKGICLTSAAINEAYAAIQAAHVKSVYAVNYSLAYPIYVLSNGSLKVEEFCWKDLTQERIDELFAKLKSDPDGAILYRYCGCKTGEASWIQYLNKDPQISDFIKRVNQESRGLNHTSLKDAYQTEFVVLTTKKNQ